MIQQWTWEFGQTYANGLRGRRPHPGDKWHLDEAFIKIAGKTHYLWRAVDQHGAVLDILVTSRRNAKAATRFFRTLLKGLEYVPRVLVTDKLASYGVARHRLSPGWSIAGGSIWTIGRRTPTNRPASVNGRWRSSAHLVARNGSGPRSAGYPRTCAPAATDSPPSSTDTRWPPDSPPGTRSSTYPRPPDSDRRIVHTLGEDSPPTVDAE
jgi:hypothetical protein